MYGVVLRTGPAGQLNNADRDLGKDYAQWKEPSIAYVQFTKGTMNTHVAGRQAAKSRAAAPTKADRLKDEVESLRSRLAKLNAASLGIVGSLDVDAVLQAVIDASPPADRCPVWRDPDL